MDKKKIIRITTVPASLGGLLTGQLSYMSGYYDVLGVSSSGNKNQLENVAKQEGIPTYSIEMTRKITPIKDLIALVKLYKLFKREHPYIIHSHTPKAGTLSMIAGKLACVPNRLHTIAGLPLVEATGIKRIVLNAVEKVTYACATKIYPNSYGLRDIILDNNFTNEKKIKVISNGSSNGIDTSYFNPKDYNDDFKNSFKLKLQISKDDFVFVFVGRLVADKGINELIVAFQKLNKLYSKVKLVLVGDFENHLDPLFPKTLDIINTNKNIISTGWIDDVRPCFAISNALVFPSYREGFPNVVMQAAAMELPSIVSNINGCNEIIEDRTHGLIIPVKDETAIYNAMAYIITHKEIAINMGKASRANIISKYERQKVWEALLNEYKQLEFGIQNQ
tara:strand:+ start:14894 stop:16069 length:1176 start_codon:yes stop_codon:yes gene_type:complete